MHARLGLRFLFYAMGLLASPSVLAAPASPEARSRLVVAASGWLPGDRIRVVSPEPYYLRTTGWFSSLKGDSAIQVRMSRGEPPVMVGLYQIGALEEKVGTRRHVVTGMAVGLVIGTLVGFAVAPEEDTIPFSKKTYIVMGAVSGMLLGGTVGFFAKTDRFGLVVTFD